MLCRKAFALRQKIQKAFVHGQYRTHGFASAQQLSLIHILTDPDMAKAAQWCTEQGTMATKGDRFEPEGWTPKFKRCV